jgi:hypothetical protein
MVTSFSSALIRRLQNETKYGDSSGPLFSLYSKSAEKYDNMVAERWLRDAEGIIIFVCTKVVFYVAAC